MFEKESSMLDKERFALKLSNFEFAKINLTWLGFEINDTGIRPKNSKSEAVMALQPQKFLKQFRSFMRSLNQMYRFIPNL